MIQCASISEIQRDMTVFDLYSGTGTISQIAAAVARRVVGVEIVERGGGGCERKMRP